MRFYFLNLLREEKSASLTNFSRVKLMPTRGFLIFYFLGPISGLFETVYFFNGRKTKRGVLTSFWLSLCDSLALGIEPMMCYVEYESKIHHQLLNHSLVNKLMSTRSSTNFWLPTHDSSYKKTIIFHLDMFYH